jgi:hypothetical protein
MSRSTPAGPAASHRAVLTPNGSRTGRIDRHPRSQAPVAGATRVAPERMCRLSQGLIQPIGGTLLALVARMAESPAGILRHPPPDPAPGQSEMDIQAGQVT